MEILKDEVLGGDNDSLKHEATEDKRWCVYKHTNKLNGKVYIGQTCQPPKYRWGSNGSGYRRNTHFWSAIQKYGWHNFEHDVLFDAVDQETAIQKETELIALYDSTNPDNGYNISIGGASGLIGVHMTEETKKKISQATKGKTRSEEAKRNISLGHKGLPQKPLSEEHKKKIIESTIIPVIQMDENENIVAIYSSISEAARITNLSKGGICSCCKGKRKTLGGFKWRYKYNNC